MNREESIKFLALIKVAYPYTYKDIDKETANATVNMWHNTFSDVPYEIIGMAFDHFRRISNKPPTVADMYKELRHLYWTATMEACSTDNEELRKKCQCIMVYTDFCKSADIKHSINLKSIERLPMPSLTEGGQ